MEERVTLAMLSSISYEKTVPWIDTGLRRPQSRPISPPEACSGLQVRVGVRDDIADAKPAVKLVQRRGSKRSGNRSAQPEVVVKIESGRPVSDSRRYRSGT